MRGVTRHFGATVALDCVDLEVRAGEIHALVGENGAGKSTLMRTLSGALRPDSGQIHLDGAPFRPRRPMEARAAGISMVYQELSLVPRLTVAENLLLGLEPTRWGVIDRRASTARVNAALSQAGHRELLPETRVSDLSMAARQRVEIARALVTDCRVLILDEPTSSLAADDVNELFQLVLRLRDRGLAVVYISHFLEEVKRLGDRFTVLRDGRTVGSGSVADTSIAAVAEMMVGRRVEQMFTRSPRRPGTVALTARGVVSPPRVIAADLEARRGEVLGIAGLVGAGRTELLRALFGLDSVRTGQVRLGLVSAASSPRHSLAQGMGLLSEDRQKEGLAAGRSVSDNLTLSRLEGVWGISLPAQRRAAARQWIDRLAIRCQSEGQAVGQLSGGNQQKVALGRLLHADVDVLLLDEPTRGVDVGSKAQIYALIDELASRGDKAVVLVSSYLPELLGMCDRLAVMCRGRLGPARPVAGLTERDILLAATGHTPIERPPA